jgi:glycerophosphoryl diester phosphodiesterase
VIIHGHRGARFEAPENTLPGFEYAKSIGLTALEFDIHLTKDEHLVVIHDATVDRTTNGTGNVADLTLEEIQALEARSIFPEWPEPCFVPTFTQVLGVIRDFEMMEIEIKKDSPERLEIVVPKVLEELEAAKISGRALITSFEPYALELARNHAPDRERGFIGAFDTQEWVDKAVELGARRAGTPFKTSNADIVRKLKDLDIETVGWPCNTREEFDAHMSREVDYLCSDAPTTIRGFLAESGH